MAVTIPRGPRPAHDAELQQIAGALERYQADHPGAEVDAYRHGQYMVYIRITDPGFAGKSLGQRHKSVWVYLAELPEEVFNDVSVLVTLTPEDRPTSYASMDFDDPIPTPL